MIGLETTPEIWHRLSTHFASHTTHTIAKIKNLKFQLKASKKERSVHTYLLDVKNIVETLAPLGAPLSMDEHIKVILDGLLEEYDAFVTAIMSRLDPYTVD